MMGEEVFLQCHRSASGNPSVDKDCHDVTTAGDLCVLALSAAD
jgi:hypothetical protein